MSELNVYTRSDYIEGRTVAEVLQKLKQIEYPIKVLDWVSHDSMFYAIVLGDIRIRRRVKREILKDIHK